MNTSRLNRLCRIIPCVAILCLCSGLRAQGFNANGANDTLATVDSWPITTNDLFERISLMPFEVKTEDHDWESVKRKAVESLVGERLLSLAFKENEVPDSWHMDRVRIVLEKILSRDEMYKQEVRDRVTIADAEVLDGVNRYKMKRRLLVCRSLSYADAARKGRDWLQSRRGGRPDASFFSSMRLQPDTVLIGFGSADTALEDAAYRLKDTLAISGPVKTVMFGWVVAALLRAEPNPEALGKSEDDEKKEVRQELELRKESVLATGIVDRILRGNRMDADSTVFRMVAKRLWEMMRSDTTARRIPKGYRYLPDDIYQLLGEFKTQLDQPIVRMSTGALSLGEFLEYLFHYDFAIPSLHPRSFVVSLFEILRTVTESELIAQEALRRGYQHNGEVIRDEAKWMEYWKSRYAEFSVVDTTTYGNTEIFWSLWRYHTALVESTCVLSVQEVLLADSSGAVRVLRMIQDGAGMDSLASRFTRRRAWSARGGRSGWFRFDEHKALSSKMMLMD
ncbi:MAG TPA: hypothetical protein VI758_01015, partial [Bacteroidota bacterium]